MKHNLVVFIFLISIFAPWVALATCDTKGYTVVYVNGILTTKKDAELDVNKLQDYLGYNLNSENLVVRSGYNPSHLAGVGDLIESASQLSGSPISDYDLKTILSEIQPKIATRKILLVGHSQGTFYTNEIYDYLIVNGEPKESISVYNVATPASSTAGGGGYLTSSNDKVINAVRVAAATKFGTIFGARQPLPANISIPLTPREAADPNGGHSFGGVYLANAAPRIVSEINSELKQLVANGSDNADSGCFALPSKNFSYRAQQISFAIADPTAAGLAAAKSAVNKETDKAVAAVVLAAKQTAVKIAAAAKQTAVAVEEVDGAVAELVRNSPIFSPAAAPLKSPMQASVSEVRNNSVAENAVGESGSPAAGAEQISKESETNISNQAPAEKEPTNPPQAEEKAEPERQQSEPRPSIAGMENEPRTASRELSDLSEQTTLLSQKAQARKEQTETSALKSESGESEINNKENESHRQIAINYGGGGAAAGGVGIVSNQDSSASNSVSQNSSSSDSQNNASSSTSENSSSTESSNSSSSSSSIVSSSSTSASSSASHILISEVLFNPAGSDEGKEFVEIYNPTENEIDLSGWSLKYRKENTTSSVSLASFKTSSHPEDKTLIQKKRFLLVGLNGYASTSTKPADITRTAALLNGETSGGQPEKIELMLYNASSSEIDKISYDKNSIASEGQSLERKVLQSGVCVSAQNNGEFLGNSCDTGQDGDFEIRSSPNPQNSGSLPEPRSVPSISNFQVVYNFSPRFDFSWDVSSDSTGATSTLSYYISDITDSSSTSVIFTASSTATSSVHSINEVGRDYHFQFKVKDRDGLSNSVSANVSASSFLDKFYFYRDSRPSSTAYFFDLTTTSSRPFWNVGDMTSTESSWKAVVFYLDKDAPKQGIISTENNLIPSDSAFVRVGYSICGGGEGNQPEIIFPLNYYSCQPGPLSAGAYLFHNLEDSRFAVQLASSSSDVSFSSSTDYVTLAFYDFGGGGGGSQRLRLAAVDTKKYYFNAAPQNQNAPTTPGNFSVDFSSSTGKLNLGWSSSTDSDTLDFLIHYEVNYSTSTALSDSAWQSVGSLLSDSKLPTFPNSYKIGVRAVDGFGNASAPAVLDWSFPSGFVLLPSQLSHGEIIGTDGSGQKIFIANAAALGGAALFVEPGDGYYNTSQSFVEIHRDSSGSIGALIATSTANTIGQYEAPRELVYNFFPAVSLEASSSYWLVLNNGPLVRNGTRVYGTISDSYQDGFWSSRPGYDGYFRLIQQ